MSINKLISSLCILIAFTHSALAQYTSGKIVFERRTNLYKKFKNDESMKDLLGDANKNKIEGFELYFNDTISAFKPKDSDERDYSSWMTNKSLVYQNVASKSRLTEKDIFGENFFVKDTVRTFNWKILDTKRIIAGYQCRKALWRANDSVKIYAWYCTEISNSIGPESFVGLPGMILGLATEDGGVVYFAKSVELTKQELTELLPPKKTRQKTYSNTEIRVLMQQRLGNEKWAKRFMYELFEIW